MNRRQLAALSVSVILVFWIMGGLSIYLLSNSGEPHMASVGAVAGILLVGTTLVLLAWKSICDQLIEAGRSPGLACFEAPSPASQSSGQTEALISAIDCAVAELHVRSPDDDISLTRDQLLNQALLSATPAPAYLLSAEGKIVDVNPAAKKLNGHLGLGEVMPKKLQRLFDRCESEGSNHLPEDPRDALLFRIDDEETYYLPRIFRFASEDGFFPGWAVLLHDVTRIRWLDDLKTNLLSTVSHEIKTPLTSIRMVLHLLNEDDPGLLSSRQKTMLNSATDECERLLETLNSLLELSRKESGMANLEREALELESLVKLCVDRALDRSSGEAVSIKLDSGARVPKVFADPLRLPEVVSHLLSNAIKHSPSGSEILLQLRPVCSSFVRLSVIDSGSGVSDDDREHVFERFFRAADQGVDGVGLGLFISREIMRAHEGRIGLSDAREDGKTEFFIDLPIVNHEAAAQVPQHDSCLPARSSNPLRSPLHVS